MNQSIFGPKYMGGGVLRMDLALTQSLSVDLTNSALGPTAKFPGSGLNLALPCVNDISYNFNLGNVDLRQL